jgi:HSP20 family protein
MAVMLPTIAGPAQMLSEMFDRVFGPVYSPFSGGGLTGPQGVLANVYEAGDTYHAVFLIPGIDPQTLQVTALGDTITVAGARQVADPEGGKIVWQEFGSAEFSRQIGLPVEVDPAKIEATYTNGVLLVTAPKAEHARARQIQVKM